jgi:hypothetical protein
VLDEMITVNFSFTKFKFGRLEISSATNKQLLVYTRCNFLPFTNLHHCKRRRKKLNDGPTTMTNGHR